MGAVPLVATDADVDELAAAIGRVLLRLQPATQGAAAG
jgi:hypothetical protein